MMAIGFLSAIKKFKLKHANNPELQRLRQANGEYNRAIEGKDKLFDDAENKLIDFGASQPFDKSVEYDDFTKSYRNKKNEQEGRRIAIRAFIKKLYFPNMLGTDFEKYYVELETAWRSGITTLFRDAMESSINWQNEYKLIVAPKALIKYEDGKWHVYAQLSEIAFDDSNGKRNHIPGMVTAHFVLTNKVFNFESYETDNPLLDDLCLKNRVNLTDKLLKPQLKEYEFQQAVDDLKFNIELCKDNRKAPAQAVLDEIVRLKSSHFNKPTLEEMTRVLSITNQLVVEENPNTIEFHNLALNIAKRSWGKLLAEAMLCLAGAALTIVSGAVIGMSAGIATPLGAVGIVAGTAMMASGGLMLFKNLKKKPILEKMEIFKKAVDDPTYVMPLRKV